MRSPKLTFLKHFTGVVLKLPAFAGKVGERLFDQLLDGDGLAFPADEEAEDLDGDGTVGAADRFEQAALAQAAAASDLLRYRVRGLDIVDERAEMHAAAFMGRCAGNLYTALGGK